MNSNHPSNPVGSVGSNRCHRWVVLLSPTGAAPPALLVGLDRHGARVVVVADPQAVMVELAAEPRHAVVVHEPQQVADLNELLDAIATYYPSVVCWRYERKSHNGKSRLTKIDARTMQRDSLSTEETERIHEPVVATSPIRPAYTSQDVASQCQAAYMAMPEVQDDPLLTQAELNMLLGDTSSGESSTNEE